MPRTPRTDPPRAAPYVPGAGRARPELPIAGLLAADGAGQAGFSATLFAYGVDRFNGGYAWEAHECWEVLWRREPRGTRRWFLLRGLIQFAAARVKAAQGRAEGAAELHRRGLAALDQGLSPSATGDPLPGFDAEEFLRDARRTGDSGGLPPIRWARPAPH